MGLVASSSELSLLDLLQVKGLARASCHVAVNGWQHEGALYLQDGVVVHASYGPLQGEAAAYAILAESTLEYRATSDVSGPPPNMRVTPAALALEAARRADESARRQVVPIAAARGSHPLPAPPRPAAPAAPPARTAAPAPTPRRRAPLLAAAALGALLLAAGAGALVARHGAPAGAPAAHPGDAAAPAQAAAPAAAPAAPVEATALHAPGDSLPVLVQGAPPRSPDPAAALRPSIVCRVLVGADGTVARAEIYQRRPDLAVFEEAALQAVRGYRFEPARRAGSAVPVWINWPVDFI